MAAGEADNMLHLCLQLASRNIEIDLLTTKGLGMRSDLPFRVHTLMRNWSWKDLPRLILFLRTHMVDAILLYYIGWIYNDHPMITFLPTVAKAVCPRVAVVTQFANTMGAVPCPRSICFRLVRKAMTLWAGSKNICYLFGTLLRDSDQIIVYSDLHREALAREFPPIQHKSVLIPPPPLLHMSTEASTTRMSGRTALGVGASEFLIAYFGYIYPGKGLENLLGAFAIIRRKIKAARLVIIGGFLARDRAMRPNYVDELKKLALELGIASEVTWTGRYPSDSEIGSVYLRAADVCVLPFDYGVQMNNSSLSAAAAHGLPVIATRAPNLEASLRHGENIFLCPPKDVTALAVAIEAVMIDHGLRVRLNEGINELREKWYSWPKVIDRTIDTIQRSIGKTDNRQD